MFRQDGEWLALLPAAIVVGDDGRKFVTSPFGASIGGFVLPLGQSVETTLTLVGRLKQHAASSTLDGVEMRLGPSIYMREPNENLGFALSANGFQLVRRWISHAVPLVKNPDDTSSRFKRGKQRDIRAGLRRGLNPREAAVDKLAVFYELLTATKTRQGAKPTHSQEELADLFCRVPGRLRLFLCEKDGRELAGVLVFVLNDVAGFTFYICQDESNNGTFATTVLVAHVAQKLGAEGLRWLDLGPSSFDDYSLNSGLAFFKEGFGAHGFCRDTWRWDRG
jgi:hypothetical protein